MEMKGWPLLLALACAALAVLVPYWPLALLSVLVAALGGEWAAAIAIGIFFDILYGRPPGGWLHAIAFPFTILAAALSLARRFAARYLRRERQEYL